MDHFEHNFDGDEHDDDPLQRIRLVRRQHFQEELGILLDQIEDKRKMLNQSIELHRKTFIRPPGPLGEAWSFRIRASLFGFGLTSPLNI